MKEHKIRGLEPGHFLRGICMGCADSIPGVSGGTIALILGIYERLVGAISHCDFHLLGLILRGKWRNAWTYADMGFLFILMAGIITGILVSASLVLYLLEHHLSVTFSAFTGLILGSAWVVFRSLHRITPFLLFMIILSALSAFFLMGINPVSGSSHLGYVFTCGVIAICAMILPGISGSYILMILGEYPLIVGYVRDITHGTITLNGLMILVIFALGCILGLVFFTKFLRWLLSNYHQLTLAVLCGFMVGALRSLWPFQEMKKGMDGSVSFSAYSPSGWDYFLPAVALVAGFFILLLLESVGKKQSS